MEQSDYIRKLEDLRCLLSRKDIIEACNDWLSHVFALAYDFSNGKIEHEIITKELIEWLTTYLGKYSDRNKVVVLEVCAGNGKLAYYLQQSLKERYWNVFDYYAVDNWDSNRENKLSIVENIDNMQWIITYAPDIVISSRLPFHPYNILPRGFQKRLYELTSKKKLTDQEQQEYDEMRVLYLPAMRWNDITYYRRQTPNINEYILIGNTSLTWDENKTYWYKKESIPYSMYDRYSTEDLENLRMEDTPLFMKDWFTKHELLIPTLNRANLQHGFDKKQDNSQIFSFVRTP